MGAQQVLRFAAVVVAATLAWTPAARAQSAEPVVVIDLRPGTADDRRPSRETFTHELGQVAGVQLVTDRELARALAAEPPPDPAADARKASAQLMSQLLVLRSSGDCSGRTTIAAKAVTLLAGLEAAGRKVQSELRIAYAYVLGCAHADGDAGAAQVAADRLRALGQTAPPDGVDAAVWNTYPAPAQPPATIAVTIDGAPTGATVWIDHVAAGTAPVTVQLAPGFHVVGAAHETGVSGSTAEVGAGADSVTYRIERVPSRWSEVRSQVFGFRAGETSANALAIAKLLELVGTRFAVLLTHGDRAELWTAEAGANAARRLLAGVMKAPLPLANAVVEEVRRLAGKPPEGDVQILTEPAKKEEAEASQKWWVYASIIGAVALGATLVIANDLADDRQRFELSWP